jgi:hypothetical protein
MLVFPASSLFKYQQHEMSEITKSVLGGLQLSLLYELKCYVKLVLSLILFLDFWLQSSLSQFQSQKL